MRLALPGLTRLLALAAALLGLASTPALAQSTMVCLQTAQGPIDFQLYDAAAPRTVANFLGHVRSGAYNNTFFHRSAPGFVVQAGGYVWPLNGSLLPVTAGPTLANEFSADRSNLRGTVAMAKLGGDPDSASSQWFVNLADNSAILDAGRSVNSNGGYSVFGRVTPSSMVSVDWVAAQRVVNATSPFDELPVVGWTPGTPVVSVNVVRADTVAVLPGAGVASDSDRIFNLLEARYPPYLPLTGVVAGTDLGYYFRHYPRQGAYLGTQGGFVYYLVPAIDGNIHLLGSVAEWVAAAAAEGY